MLPLVVFFLLCLATSARAAISILYPNTNTIWYKNNTVSLNWTLSDPTTDTYLFRVLLSNQDQSIQAGNASLADSTNATAQYVRFLLPGVPASQGYVVNLVNTTNEAQVFATSQAFEIQDGAVTTSTAASTSIAQTSAGAIPNAVTRSGSVSAYPSATFTSTTGSTGGAGVQQPLNLLGPAAMVLALCLGMAVVA